MSYASPATSRFVRIDRLVATWFGCGLVPVAPGTVASVAALFLAISAHHYLNWGVVHFLLLAAAFTPVGIWASTRTAEAAGAKDPAIIVVDEVLGQWLTLSGATAFTPASWLLAFGLFRLFDIAKPWPIRRLEALPRGTGIVVDDLGAGVYAALVLFLAGWFNLY